MKIRILLSIVCVAGWTWPIAVLPAVGVPTDAVAVVAQPPRSPRVWVNRRSALYHCPGSKWYGTGKNGFWTTEAAARAKGYRAAYNRVCGT